MIYYLQKNSTRLFAITFCGFLFSSSFAQQLSVEAIWKNYEYVDQSVDGFNSMKDGIHYTRVDENGNIRKFDITNAKDQGTIIVDASTLKYDDKAIRMEDYEFNSDESKLLIKTNIQSIYRRSYTAFYYLYDIASKKLTPLDQDHPKQTLADYSPDGTKVAFVYKNDIFVKDLAKGTVRKMTEKGKKNKIINGTTDWVYEEEFAITKGFYWSPDSKKIAFLCFNEENVRDYHLDYFKDSLYPTVYDYKYPKAGEDNSKVTIHLLDVKSAKSTQLALTNYEYIPRLTWVKKSNKLLLLTLNRHQNELKYHLFDCAAKKIVDKVIYTETSKTYVEIDDNLSVLNDDMSFLRASEEDGYNHIYRIYFDGKKEQITKGKFDIIQLYGIDNSNEFLYYSSAENGAISKAIYKIKVDGTGKTLISLPSGYSDAQFTAGYNYFIKSYSTANTPTVYSLCDNSGKMLQVLEDNKELQNKLDALKLNPKEFMTFDFGDYSLNGWMIKPKNFDPNKKYPVYMTVYGGPGSNEVTDDWGGMNYMYQQLLAENGYIVCSVDPRGTMYQGAEFKKSTYLQLGKLEIEDVIKTAKELQKLNYVDADRFGIMGWSYGGFMASLAITKGADVFKMAIAVAPVTNWKYYDNIYTERFMRTPKENKDGYEKNSPVNFAKDLKGKYLLIHGTGDDNVHVQNSFEMINAMVKANKQFDLFVYPNKDHGIYGGNTRNHLFNMMFEYTKKNL
ncbi:MAG: S9 family peptidase [Bacteroidota bacterium]